MNIAVLVKQVPEDPAADPATAARITDPVGRNALEAAVQLTEATGGTVTVITLGPAAATSTLKECISVGAHAGIRVDDEGLSRADGLTIARVLAAAVRRLDGVDLVLAGARSYDGGTPVVPAMVAELLGLPAVTAVTALDAEDGGLLCTRVVDDGHERVRLPLPGLVTVDEHVNTPRYPSVKSKLAANKARFDVIGLADLGVTPAPHTVVVDVTEPPVREPGTVIAGDTAQDTADKLVAALVGAGVL